MDDPRGHLHVADRRQLVLRAREQVEQRWVGTLALS